MNYGIFIGLLFWIVVFLFIWRDWDNKLNKGIWKCPNCKKRDTVNQPLNFGEFETCKHCGHEFIPSGMIPFLPLIDELKKGIINETCNKRRQTN